MKSQLTLYAIIITLSMAIGGYAANELATARVARQLEAAYELKIEQKEATADSLTSILKVRTDTLRVVAHHRFRAERRGDSLAVIVSALQLDLSQTIERGPTHENISDSLLAARLRSMLYGPGGRLTRDLNN